MQLAAAVLLAFLSLACHAQTEEVTFPTAPGSRFPAKEDIQGVLDLPAGSSGKVPVVVVIHTAGGYDRQHNELYAAPLRAAGIATLGLVVSRAHPSQLPSYYIPHVFGAFKYLAAHPRIDPARIGVMGMSFGGILSIYAASELLSAEHLGAGRFAAHAALYPVCWIHEAIASGQLPARSAAAFRDVYARLTGAPVKILAGEKDDDDEPDSCQKFLAALSPEARKTVDLVMFPGTTHAWDQGRTFQYFDRVANKGKGGNVNVVFDPNVTAKGREAVVEFFAKHLGASK